MPNKVQPLWPSLPGAPSEPDEAAPRARVLLVDDVPANLVALEAVLAPLGQELVLAGSGEEALRHLMAGDFACILMDVQMPGLSGLDTAALIRSRERTRHIPILFITALNREAAHVMSGYAQGAADYLLKPVDPDILRAKVGVFVELYRRGKALERQAVQLAEHRRAEAELRRGAELEQQLVGIVGHDIRTPLTSILATARGQLANRHETLPPEQLRAFERVARGGERIGQIVDLLLDFTRARIGGGIPVVRVPGDLAGLVHRIVDEVQAAHPGRALSLALSEEPLWGDWDLERLAQVLANLLENALKYGPANDAVTVRLVRDGERVVRLEVHNRGPAIPEGLVPELFEPFRRGPAQAEAGTERKSLGLGLYITREIVAAHGGSIQVDSSGEHGTTFRVCLPRFATTRVAPCDAPPHPLSA